MSTVYLSICLCHLQFLSSVSYSFQSIIYSCIFYSFCCNWIWIIFLSSLSDSLLYLYRNTTDFCILILYPTTLLNLFITFNSFGVIFRIFFICKQWQFCFFLSNLDSFYYFSCLTAMTRTSNTLLNKGGKSGHPCLIPNLRGNTFSFSPLSLILAVGVPHS